ncbi:hypothetical protein [Glycomyces salinus]|uniref:hypothetical protein n=1 Tax=Glycomyces salinus TaxID=980294 RepID=UPI0018EAC59D|nr:hypothetical protein [Glycomyces salinus]
MALPILLIIAIFAVVALALAVPKRNRGSVHGGGYTAGQTNSVYGAGAPGSDSGCGDSGSSSGGGFDGGGGGGDGGSC